MADPPPRRGRLDPTADQEVVFCHQCQNEWFRQNGSLVCPQCDGEITEIINPADSESDPRPLRASSRPQTPPEFRSLRGHNPWRLQEEDAGWASDPDEADIEEAIEHRPGSHGNSRSFHGPNGSAYIYTRTTRAPARPLQTRHAGGHDVEDIMQGFQRALTGVLGPELQPGRPSTSGPNDLYPPPDGMFMGGGGGGGPRFAGGTFTYTTMRNPDGAQGGPPVDDIATLIGNLFGGGGRGGLVGNGPRVEGGMPEGLSGLFASLLDPRNQRQGDAVWSQEALDDVIQALMAGHQGSNAPGPASPADISALPKIKLDEKRLGPEHKGECTVCMDDVHIGDEVVELPCTHWFHEACARLWLNEHNTCPICRNAIGGGGGSSQPAPSSSRRQSQPGPTRHNSNSQTRSRADGVARLRSIRNAGWPRSADPSRAERNPESPNPLVDLDEDDPTPFMPGSFSRRSSGLSENQRDSRGQSSRASRRNSTSNNNSNDNGGGNSGVGSWLRERFGGNSRN